MRENKSHRNNSALTSHRADKTRRLQSTGGHSIIFQIKTAVLLSAVSKP